MIWVLQLVDLQGLKHNPPNPKLVNTITARETCKWAMGRVRVKRKPSKKPNTSMITPLIMPTVAHTPMPPTPRLEPLRESTLTSPQKLRALRLILIALGGALPARLVGISHSGLRDTRLLR